MVEGYLFLGLTVAANAAIFTIFKIISRKELELLQAIVINYLTCLVMGLIISPEFVPGLINAETKLQVLTLVEGFLFISMFFLMGYITGTAGMGISAMLTKASMVLPVAVAFVLWDEPMTPAKWLALGMAVISVILINLKKKQIPVETGVPASAPHPGKDGIKVLILSIVLFFGSGLVDTNMQVFAKEFGDGIPNTWFITGIFGIAGILGSILLIINLIRKKTTFDKRAIAMGFILGLVNYFSIWFVLSALETLSAGVFWPMNNLCILMLTAFIGMLIFREKYHWYNYAGMGLAVTAILLLL